MRPLLKAGRALVAAMALMWTACADPTLGPWTDPLDVRVVDDEVAAQVEDQGRWVSFMTTLELHNRSTTETIAVASCGAFVLTDAMLAQHLDVVCPGMAGPSQLIRPGETITLEVPHFGCLASNCGPSWEFDGIAGRYRVRVQYLVGQSPAIEQASDRGANVALSDSFVLTLG